MSVPTLPLPEILLYFRAAHFGRFVDRTLPVRYIPRWMALWPDENFRARRLRLCPHRLEA